MKLRKILFLTCLSSLIACNKTETQAPSDSSSQMLSSFPVSGNLRISLTDAPSMTLKNVFVNVDHAEIFVNKGGVSARVVVAQNLGLVDLMTLRNGVMLPLQDVNLASGTEITAIRLVLKADNNHAIRTDDSRCEMQTPSGQQSGIKIILSQAVTLENSAAYSMVIDFDAEKSVVIQGTGDCLLKPVLKLLQVAKIPEDSSSGGSDTGGVIPVPVTDGTDANTGGDSATDGGFEIPIDPVTEPAVISSEETFAIG